MSKYERVRLARKSRKQAHRLQKSGIVSRTAEWLNGIIRQAQSEEDRYESLFGGGVGKITVDVESSRIAILMSTKYDHLLSFEVSERSERVRRSSVQNCHTWLATYTTEPTHSTNAPRFATRRRRGSKNAPTITRSTRARAMTRRGGARAPMMKIAATATTTS